MDFEEIIEIFRTQINSLNETDHLEVLNKPKEIKSLSSYYQNTTIKGFEYKMKKSNRLQKTRDTQQKKLLFWNKTRLWK